MAADNMSLGRFRLEGIPAAPRGIPQVEVTFDIDANGILNVSAMDKASGREQRVTITASTNLNKPEIERLVKEAEQHRAEDDQRRENAEARNTADTVIYQAEKLLKEQGDAMPQSSRAEIESSLNNLRQAAGGQDTAHIRRLAEELQRLLTQAAAQPSGPAQAAGGNGHKTDDAGEGEVVEGEFKEA